MLPTPDSSETMDEPDAPDDLRRERAEGHASGARTPEVRPAYRRAYETARDAAKQVLRRRFRAVRLARDAYRKTLDHEDAVSEVKTDLLALVRLVRAWAGGDYRQVSSKTLLSILGAVLYFVSPLDAIPDFIPVVGLVDDVAVVAAVVRSVRADLDRFRAWEAEQQHEQLPSAEAGSGTDVAPTSTASSDGAPPRLSS